MSKQIDTRDVRKVPFDSSDLSYLEGEILTIVDALMPAPESDFTFSTGSTFQRTNNTQSQNAAAKSLIKAAFGRSLSKFGIARG